MGEVAHAARPRGLTERRERPGHIDRNPVGHDNAGPDVAAGAPRAADEKDGGSPGPAPGRAG